MANFDNSADLGKQIIIKFLKERMDEKKVSQYKLSQLTGISESVLSQNFRVNTEMSVTTLLKICGALELRPYFIPSELDKNEIKRVFFS